MRGIFNGNEKKGGIYRIVNIKNGKFYIGSTKNFKKRACDHEYCLRNNKHDNGHLQASWNKWGEEAFVFEVVEIVEGNKGERYKVEQQYIDRLIKEKKWDQTFNIRKKADQKEPSCFSKNPEETRRKKSESVKKLYSDPEYRAKHVEILRKAAQKRTKTYHFISPSGEVTTITNLKEFCKNHPELHLSGMHAVWKEKVRSCRKWKKFNSNVDWDERKKRACEKKQKSIYQFSTDGTLIRKFNSVKEAASALGLKSPTNISACARGQIKTAYNFVWKFDDKQIDLEKLKKKKGGRPPKKIYQFDLQNNLLRQWNSISEAAEKIGCSVSSISACARGKKRTIKGFLWSYNDSIDLETMKNKRYGRF